MLNSYKARFGGVLALLGCGQIAGANANLYEGDCNRARAERQYSSVDKIINFSKYRGVRMKNYGIDTDTSCWYDQVEIFSLKQISRSKSAVVFYARVNLYDQWSGKLKCRKPHFYEIDMSGTLTFTVKLSQDKEICTLSAYAQFDLSDAHNNTWKDKTYAPVVIDSFDNLVISQPNPFPDKPRTPLVFSGVK